MNISASDVAARLAWEPLMNAIRSALADPQLVSPERTVHDLGSTTSAQRSLLIKPAWVPGDLVVTKLVTFTSDDAKRGLSTVNAIVIAFDGLTGQLVGTCDGNELTTRRTAAASALAADHLARPDAARLLIVGAGALAPRLAEAHSTVRALDDVAVWARRPEAAQRVVDELAQAGFAARVATDLGGEVRSADVISTATSSTAPLVFGSDVAPGTHVDLVGAFTPAMREADANLITAADVWVDTIADACLAGDLASPIAASLFDPSDIVGDLASLCDGSVPGRTRHDQITVFKSVGMALYDLAAARLVFNR
jgi:alanine dehydrogenase